MIRLIDMEADRFGVMPYLAYHFDCLIGSIVSNFRFCNRA